MRVPLRIEKFIETIISRLEMIQEALGDHVTRAEERSATNQHDRDDEWRGRVGRTLAEREIQKREERKKYAQTQKGLNNQFWLNILTFFAVTGAWLYAAIATYQAVEMRRATRAAEESTETSSKLLNENAWQFRQTLREMRAQTRAQLNAAAASQTGADAAKSAATTAKDALVIGNRPWIKVLPGIIKPLTFDVGRNGGQMATMTLRNHLENVGQSVAQNVVFWEDVFPVDADHSFRTALARQKQWCDANRHNQPDWTGSVRFPHDPWDEDSMVGPSMAKIEEVIEQSQNDPQVPKGQVSFVLVGCVAYRSSSSLSLLRIIRLDSLTGSEFPQQMASGCTPT
jgi:hypothetical protein